MVGIDFDSTSLLLPEAMKIDPLEQSRQTNVQSAFGPIHHEEFDPGSELTLAARLKHASRTVRSFGIHEWQTGE